MAEMSEYSIKIRRRKRKKAKEKAKKQFNKGLLFVLAVVSAAAIVSKYVLDNSDKVRDVFTTVKPVKTVAQQTYLQGVKIDGIDIGGLNYEQAKTLLTNSVNTATEGNAVVIKSTDGSKQYTYSYKDFGISYNLERALSDAMEVGTVEEEYDADFKALENGGINFSIYTYSRPKITSFVRAIGRENTAEPKNAVCTNTGSGFDITPEQMGYSVDSDELLAKTLAAIDSRTFNLAQFTLDCTEILSVLHVIEIDIISAVRVAFWRHASHHYTGMSSTVLSIQIYSVVNRAVYVLFDESGISVPVHYQRSA